MNYLEFIKNLISEFNSAGIEYMLIGGGALILQGFDMVTQDIDVYIQDSKINNKKVILSLEKLSFNLSNQEKKDILSGKDFIQFNTPLDLDIVFYPDGFESYEEAKKYKIYKELIPLMDIDGILISKTSANRKKDKLVIPFIKDFRIFLKKKNENYSVEAYFEIPKGYKYADNQTINRWKRNLTKNIWSLLEKGILQ